MTSSTKPSSAVIAAGIVSLVVSTALVFGAILFGLLGVLASPRAAGRPGGPVAMVVFTLVISVFLVSIAALGVAIAVGLFRLRAWARTAGLIASGFMACFSTIAIPMTIFFRASTAPQPGAIFLRAILLMICMAMFAIGICGLVLFTRKKIIAEFSEPPQPIQPANELDEWATPASAEPRFVHDSMRPEPFTVLRGRAVFGRMGLAVLATIGLLVVFLIAIRIMVGRGAALPPVTLGLTEAVFYALAALFVYRLLRHAGLSPRVLFGRALGFEGLRRYWALPFLLIGVSLTGYVALFVPLSFLLPRFVERYALRSQSQPVLHYTGFGYQLGNVLTMLAVVIAAPIVEEFVFRGILLTRWSIKWGTPRAILLSSAIFGVLHTEIIGHMFFAYVMAVLYIKTKSLFLPILMHAINNGIVWSLTLLAAGSGQPRPKTTLATFQAQGRTGLLVLSAIFIPWAAWFIIRNFPKRQWTVPYLQFSAPSPTEE